MFENGLNCFFPYFRDSEKNFGMKNFNFVISSFTMTNKIVKLFI